jgi:hypothetical protein
MGLASGVVIFFAASATLLLDRAIAIRPKLAVARRGIHLVPRAPAVLRNIARHCQPIRWIGATEFARLIQDDPDLVIFRLIDAHLVADEHGRPSGVVAATLEQLANTIPWIPCGSRIVIYRMGGISTPLANKVKHVLRGREAMFFSGNAHQAVEPVVGEPDFAA